MKSDIEKIKKFKQDNDVQNFMLLFIDNIKQHGVDYFYYCLQRDVLFNPSDSSKQLDKSFLIGLAKIPEKYKEDMDIVIFFSDTWMPWCRLFLKVDNTFRSIEGWLKENNPKCTIGLKTFSAIQISKKLETDKQAVLAAAEGQNVHNANLEALNGAVSFYDEEHHFIDTLDILLRYINFSAPQNNKIWKKNFQRWHSLYFLCQVWANWMNLWNKVKLNEYYLSTTGQDEITLIPKDKTLYIREYVGKHRFENRLKEIRMFSMGIYGDLIRNYQKTIFKIGRQHKLKMDNLPFILNSLKSDEIKTLIQLRKPITDTELVILSTIFHDVKLSEFKLSEQEDCNIEDIFNTINIFKLLSEIFSSTIEGKNTKKIAEPNYVIKFTKEQWDKKITPNIRNADKVLQYLTYPLKRTGSLDLWCTPLFQDDNDHYIFLPHIFNAVSLTYLIEQYINTFCTSLNSKLVGDAFENEVYTMLCSLENSQTYKGKIDGFEFDSLVYLDGYILIIESKRTSTVSSPYDLLRAKERMNEGVEQASKRQNYLLSKEGKDFLEKQFNIKSIDITSEKMIKIVCMNIYDLSGRMLDDVIVTDLTLLKRYLRNEKDKFEIANMGHGRATFEHIQENDTRKPGPINKEDLLNYLLNPHQITLVEPAITLKESTFPLDLHKKENIIILSRSFSSEKYEENFRDYMSSLGIDIDEDTPIY